MKPQSVENLVNYLFNSDLGVFHEWLAAQHMAVDFQRNQQTHQTCDRGSKQRAHAQGAHHSTDPGVQGRPDRGQGMQVETISVESLQKNISAITWNDAFLWSSSLKLEMKCSTPTWSAPSSYSSSSWLLRPSCLFPGEAPNSQTLSLSVMLFQFSMEFWILHKKDKIFPQINHLWPRISILWPKFDIL